MYVALTEIASDKGSDRFQTTHSWIQRLSGWSVRTIHARLKTLSDIGLIEIETPDLRAPSTYTLKAVAQPLPNDTQPLPSVRQRSKQASLPTSEERQKKLFEENQNNVGAMQSRSTCKLSDSEWLASLKADSAYVGIDVDREHAKMVRWCSENRKQPTRRRFVNWLNRADRPTNAPTAQPPRNCI